MKFSDIREGIQQAWQFLLPPFLNLFVLGSLTYYIAPQIFITLFTKAATLNFSFLRDESFQKFLEFYGVSKLAPLFFLIGFVFVLYVVNSLVSNLGHLLPGYIVDFNEGRLMHVLLLQPSKFAELWARFPDVPDANRLIVILRQRLVGADPRLAANIEYWQKRFAKYYRLSNALKFYLMWGLLLIVLLLFMKQPISVPLLRLTFTSILILIILVVLSIKQIYAIEQKAFAELSTVESLLYAEEKGVNYPGRDLVTQMFNRIWEFAQNEKDEWWEFRLVDTHQFGWFHRTLIKRKVAQQIGGPERRERVS
jgi:hypothetical protein